MSERDANDLFIKQGETFEAQGKLREAEKMYLKVREPDLAIAMYKNNKQVSCFVFLFQYDLGLIIITSMIA